jgi:hypothetical protein
VNDMNGGYTRDPVDCEKRRKEHDVSQFHIGPDPEVNCGKCIAQYCFKPVKRKVNYDKI